MDFKKSLQILNLNTNFDYYQLKKAYHINALRYHPDKNANNPEYNQRFKEINLAYKYLKNIIDNKLETDSINNCDSTNDNEIIIDKKYFELVIEFIHIITNKNCKKHRINSFKNECSDILFTLLNQLNIENLQDIYLYICNNQENLLFQNIDIEILLKIKNLILDKFKNYNVFVLKPNLLNLINNDVYCLDISNDKVYIPLWHNEFIYRDNIIKIIPSLESNIWIDNTTINYIYYDTYTNIINMISNNITEIILQDIKSVIIIEKLYIKKYQKYIIKNKGLPSINYNDIFNIDKKNDIIIHIYLE